MMHALKQRAKEELAAPAPNLSETTFSQKMALAVIHAISQPQNAYNRDRVQSDITTATELLDETVPMALLLKSLAMIEIGGPAHRYALRAFEADPTIALLAASAIGETGLTSEFLDEHFEDRGQRSVANWLLSDRRNQLIYAARTAVDAGFIRFEKGNAVLVTPEHMPSSYDFKYPTKEAA
jgi:hypothetical protein